MPVELHKTKSEKGRVWHEVKITGAPNHISAGDVLSDGEFRAISVAAFLADADSRVGSAPIVFDDPISSLDQRYEVAIAKRLVEKAKTQQVIVFTHRLSLLAVLESNAKDEGVTASVTAIGPEGKKRGVPRQPPAYAQNTKKTLNALCNQRMSSARRSLATDGWDGYEPLAQAICRDTRATLERMVERDLLFEIVRRFHPELQTKGKLRGLAKIEISDCEFIDDMMSYFSKFIHSQSEETPNPPPEADELEKALNKIKDWRDNFDARPIPAATNP